jgi:hypothetical protein
MTSLGFLERVRTLVVIAMFSDDVLMRRLVLKGGNLMDLVYDISARSSLDVDFSIDGDFPDTEDLARRVENALVATFFEDDYVVFDVRFWEVPPFVSDDLKDFWGGYKVEFKLISRKRFGEFNGDLDRIRRSAEAVGKRGSSRFEIDFSKFEFCDAKEEYYLDDYLIYGQSPHMFVCEKLRAICQQMDEYRETVRKHRALRARDFVDICVAADYFRIDFASDGFHDILRKTFAAKKVPLTLLGKLDSVRDVHREDFESVRATVKPDFPLREYDFYFEFVLERCQRLESLWNV